MGKSDFKKADSKEISKNENRATTFEEAIEKTGFGKFNYILIMSLITGNVSSMFESTSMSYTFAAAQCDLNLSLQDKGYLNSITYAGMISTSFVWGILLDKLGRKKLMVYGYFLNALIVFISGFSQSKEMLVICKFFGGMIITGPMSATIAYLGEIHSTKYRSKIQLINGAFLSFAQVLCPILAWIILPLIIEWSFFNGFLVLHSWNLFLLVIGIAPLISGITFIFLPESPKFLMTNGENEKALEILRKIYSMNSGNLPESYPVNQLIIENVKREKQNTSFFQVIYEQFKSLGPMFKAPLLPKFVLITTVQVLVMQGLNTLRLWIPQLFQAIEDYKLYNNGTSSDLCTMIKVIQPKKEDSTCSTNIGSIGVYQNSIIVATCGMCLYFVITVIINKIGKNIMLTILSWTAGVAGCSLYFARGSISTTVLSSIFISCGNICASLSLAVGAEAFPTNLRAFTICLILAFARLGAMVGNLIFPLLITLGCAPPFFVVGGYIAVGGFLAFYMPNTDKKALV